MSRRICLTAQLSALLMGIAGCGKTPAAWETVYPARGCVTYKGKPLAGAMITLVPTDATYPTSVRPSATSKEDGSFVLGTYSTGDGAPAATYKATVLHFPVVGTRQYPSPGRNDLPARYGRPETTDLTVLVAPNQPELPPLVLK